MALALSGGVARSIAHIGVLQQLEQDGIPVGAIAGTSGGSLVGAFYAVTKDLARMERMACSTKWRTVVTPLFSRRAFFDGERLAQFCASVVGTARIEELTLPFVAVATSLRTGRAVMLQEGPLVPAIVASCSLPVLFPPVEMGTDVLVDGGASSQLPVLAARETLGGSLVVGVDVNANAAGTADLNNMIQIGMQFIGLFAMANAARERAYATVMIDVDATGMPLYDLSKAELLLERGRRATEAKIVEIRAALDRPHHDPERITGVPL